MGGEGATAQGKDADSDGREHQTRPRQSGKKGGEEGGREGRREGEGMEEPHQVDVDMAIYSSARSYICLLSLKSTITPPLPRTDLQLLV